MPPHPTPPVPGRNPRRAHHHSQQTQLPTLPDLDDTEPELLPRPLAVEKKIPPPTRHIPTAQTNAFEDVIHVAVFELSPMNPPSPALSFRSLDSHTSFSSSSSSTSSSPSSSSASSTSPLARPPSMPSRESSNMERWIQHWTAPKRSLRRIASPREESLRGIRNRESDACLQRLYDECTVAYLEGRVFGELDVVLEA